MPDLDSLWNTVESELSGERAATNLERLWAAARYADFAHLNETAQRLAAMMQFAGMDDVQVIEYPTDGTTHYGGWVMPQAWDVSDARLEIASPDVDAPLLASYDESPLCVMSYSAPTPSDGITAPVVRYANVDDPTAFDGKIVLLESSSIRHANRVFQHGALGVLCDEPPRRPHPDTDAPLYRFLNYTVPPWKTRKGSGFGLPVERGKRLRDLLDERGEGNVMLHARIDGRLYDGAIPAVTGLLRGETDEEIVLTGHLCEPGANDNTSGPALAVEIARAIRVLVEQGKLPPLKRGIRLCHTYEVRGTNAFVNETDTSRIVAGINLDMVARDQINHVFGVTPTHHTDTDALVVELLARVFPDDKLRYHATGLMDDNVFGEPLIGAPTPGIVQYQDSTWHTSADTMDAISPRILKKVGVAAAVYVLAVAYGEVDLTPKREAEPSGEGTRYRKVVKGYIGCEHLSDDEKDRLDATLGIGWGWGAPDWVQHALFACDGSRTVAQVAAFLDRHGMTTPRDRLDGVLEWGASQGFL
ncbi:MAG: DUF4910 domain-containing protein, partial [Candidatus Poribacteria bacterium]|nr:DUF4910 domain-containing protein [Candidatus Poribacteria bacterium]